MRRCLVAASALLLAAPAMALETPRACSAADPRVRCIAYDPAQVVQLFAATGAALTVEFAEAETGVVESAAHAMLQTILEEELGDDGDDDFDDLDPEEPAPR